MKLRYSLKFTFLFLFSLFLLNCSSKTENIPVDIEINDFVWKGLNAYYLWQDEKPDLADRRFNNQEELNIFLAGFPSPEDIFENLLFRPTDRFSVIVDDYVALENSFQGINVSNGMEFGLVRYSDGSSNVFGYVRYVIPNSDAFTKGVTRGMIFNKVDATQLTTTNFASLLFSSNTNYVIELANYNNGNPVSNNTMISLDKIQLQENPIAISKVITDGSQKIGYLMYNQFSSAFDVQLNAAFNNFKNENINDLIIDLRYNGGGSVRTATYLGEMVTGQFTGEIFSKEIWNSKVQEAINPDNFINTFTNQINHSNITETIHSLNLTRVFFIVSGSSASASELIINSLSAYIDVKLVGTTTVGKQVGSITLYDSENYTRNGGNLNQNHTYAMQPIVLEIVNKNDQNKPNGFTPGSTLPGIVLAEDFGNLGVLGERSDPLLDRTLVYISTGNRQSFTTNSSIKNNEVYNSKLATPISNNMYVEFNN